MIDEAIAAYELRGFPYARRELDPMKDDQDLRLWCPVDGWQTAEHVGDFVAERAVARQPALVVIAGGSGTGRTSLANYLIHRWAAGRASAPDNGFDPAKLIVANGRMDDYSAEAQLYDWVLGLYPLAYTKGYEPNESTEEVFDMLTESKPAAMAAALQKALLKLTGDLASKGWALAGILEDVKKQELLALANRSLRYVDSLLITTVEDTAGNFDAVLNNVGAALDANASQLVRLGELDGPEAREVIVRRWETYAEGALPFDEQAVEDAFGKKRRPVARVLVLMELLLTGKVDVDQPVRWPDSRLKFSNDEVIRRIPYLDELLLAGR
ncbi:hypothetical protein [Streptomyces sp. NPDC046939]|uniref:hypothetical protein n=1 Tax=Streptomyces sp. NPDC046939 TaxID=3155376 RepID=UPI0033F418A1